MKVIRREGMRPVVTFLEESGQWRLDVKIEDGDIVIWAIDQLGKKGPRVGGGIVWLNGRLTAHSQRDHYDTERAASRAIFKNFIDEVGLSFGAIEAELRAVTGYQEGA